MKHKLEIFPNYDRNAWLVRAFGDVADRWRREFGTDIIESAYTLWTSVYVVKNELERLNPDCDIVVSYY